MLPKYEGSTGYVRALDDRVVGGADAVKFAMDRFGEEFKAWFNDTFLPSLLATTAGASGADNIGTTPILEGADTVQKTLAALLTQVQSAALGQLPDGTVTDAKLSNVAGQIKSRVSSLQTDITNLVGDIQSVQSDIGTLESRLDGMDALLLNYNSYASMADANGIYTVVEYKRSDGTLYMKSTLSGGTPPNYTTDTWQFYDAAGTTVIATKTWTLTYDAGGKIVSKVVA